VSYTLRGLPLDDEPSDDVRRWLGALTLGFGEAAPSEESVTRWWRVQQADAVRLRAAYPDAAVPGLPEGTPVATFASLDQTINTGHGHLEPADFITDVTVRTSHRRRGLLSRLMHTDLTEAHERGLTLAALTASEGGIYRRFGFGIATNHRAVELHTGPGFVLAAALPADAPHVEIVDAGSAAPLLRQAFSAFHGSWRGSHGRPSWYDDHLTGAWDFEKGAPDPAIRVAVAFGGDGAAVGHAVYRFIPEKESLKVLDFVAAAASTELALWRFVASVDLVHTVTSRSFSPRSPLPWALADPRALKVTGVGDYTWLRVLDVAGALAARGFDHDGGLTLAVDDPLGLDGGAWRLDVVGGRAVVEPVGEAELRLTRDALGSLYFGLADARSLAAAGRIAGPADQVAALARLFATDDRAHNITGF
jgi:predicted acetyltransferase